MALPTLEVVTVTGVGTVAMCRQATLAPTLIHLVTDPIKQIVHWVLVVILCAIVIFMLLEFVGL